MANILRKFNWLMDCWTVTNRNIVFANTARYALWTCNNSTTIMTQQVNTREMINVPLSRRWENQLKLRLIIYRDIHRFLRFNAVPIMIAIGNAMNLLPCVIVRVSKNKNKRWAQIDRRSLLNSIWLCIIKINTL